MTRQEADARALAERRRFELLEVVIDNDLSAAGGKKRPGFERVLQAVESGRVSVVIAWSLDRLTRNRRDTLRLIETCQKAGATIALVRGSDLDLSTPSGRLTADLLAAVARSEIEVKSDRQRRANQQAVAAGLWLGGRRPFGYEADGMTIRENEAEALRDAYRWLLSGVSLHEIARRWTARGFTTPQMKRDGSGPGEWTQTTLSRCLRKPRNAGLMSYKGEVTGPGQWPGIVDPDTWHAAQAVLRDPSRRPKRGDQRLLTGVALCGVCDVPVWAGGGATGRGVYRCRATQGHVIRKREPVDEFVRGVIVERLSRPDARGMFNKPTPSGPSFAELAEQHEAQRRKLEPLAEAHAEGALTLAQLRAATARILSKMEELDAAMHHADELGSVVQKLTTAPDVGAAWDALMRDTQRRIVDRLMVIRLDPPGRGVRDLRPETVRITWREA